MSALVRAPWPTAKALRLTRHILPFLGAPLDYAAGILCRLGVAGCAFEDCPCSCHKT